MMLAFWRGIIKGGNRALTRPRERRRFELLALGFLGGTHLGLLTLGIGTNRLLPSLVSQIYNYPNAHALLTALANSVFSSPLSLLSPKPCEPRCSGGALL